MEQHYQEQSFPLKISISFHKLIESYRQKLGEAGEAQRANMERIIRVADENPALTEGLWDPAELKDYSKEIHLILDDLFTPVLGGNEIKIATIPYQYVIIRSTLRFDNIVSYAGDDFEGHLNNLSDNEAYIMGCAIILNSYYGYSIDFRRPFYYNIPDKDGVMRHYRVLYNADFVDIEKTDQARDITPDDVAELIDNFENIDLWKRYFPPNSWVFKGFVLANMYDATLDVSISSFKENLISKDSREIDFEERFQAILRGIFAIPDLRVGYAIYDRDSDNFVSPVIHQALVKSYLLGDKKQEASRETLCDRSYAQLFNKKDYYTISDVKRFAGMYPQNKLYQKLLDQNVGSAIIAPLVHNGQLLGIMELISEKPQALNSINANKLNDIMPYLVDSVRQKIEKETNDVELLIQSECTSIHPSVLWKFREEAVRVIRSRYTDNPASFREIIFKNVYPLYGQMDIKGSSVARNEATKKDLSLQLNSVKEIITAFYQEEKLPIYEQLKFRIDCYLKEINEEMEVDSERRILSFLRSEIVPVFEHFSSKKDDFRDMIASYYEMLDSDKGFVYKFRKDYDESVNLVNKKMAGMLDNYQDEAQQMFPHYYERFKTDGVEHNMYIGEAITKKNNFNELYLYNLRLWQLQVMCAMEKNFFYLKKNLPIQLEVSSMILVYNTALSLRFRMDEKRFDVDGTYNARYEVVKKRVDKAFIKGTTERITQPGKITIVYSQQEDEKEYLRYISFMSSRQLVDNDTEIFELEDLQGITGLKAIRVSVLYKPEGQGEDLYTYQDLLDQL